MKALFRVLKEIEDKNYFPKNFKYNYLKNNFTYTNIVLQSLFKGEIENICNCMCKITIEDDKKTVNRLFVIKIGYYSDILCEITIDTQLEYSREFTANLYFIMCLYYMTYGIGDLEREKNKVKKFINKIYNTLKYYYEYNKS